MLNGARLPMHLKWPWVKANAEAIFFENPYNNYDFSKYDAIIVGAPAYNTRAMEMRSETNWAKWLYCNLSHIGPRLTLASSGKTNTTVMACTEARPVTRVLVPSTLLGHMMIPPSL